MLTLEAETFPKNISLSDPQAFSYLLSLIVLDGHKSNAVPFWTASASHWSWWPCQAHEEVGYVYEYSSRHYHVEYSEAFKAKLYLNNPKQKKVISDQKVTSSFFHKKRTKKISKTWAGWTRAKLILLSLTSLSKYKILFHEGLKLYDFIIT